MSWEYRVTVEITIWMKQRLSEAVAEQTAIDAIFSNPETVKLLQQDTLSVKETKRR